MNQLAWSDIGLIGMVLTAVVCVIFFVIINIMMIVKNEPPTTNDIEEEFAFTVIASVFWPITIIIIVLAAIKTLFNFLIGITR
jgi:hypothetical protein